jgi:superoxide dismutase, Fe-Mn family
MNNRREVLKTIGLSSLGLATAGAASVAHAQPQTLLQIPNAFSVELTIKPLAFEPNKLDGISERIIVSHWENNYAGSVRALNVIKKRLSAALLEEGLPAFVYNDLKREHLLRTGSVVLHELYFENLSPPKTQSSELNKSLSAAFATPDAWFGGRFGLGNVSLE